MVYDEKAFWIEYSKQCTLAYTHPSDFVKNTRRGIVAQMDIQAYFKDYQIRRNGYDCVTKNNLKIEVKTGTRFTISYSDTSKHLYSNFVAYNPHPELGSVKWYRIYNAEQFFDVIKPFTQITNQGNQNVCEIRDHCSKEMLNVLENIPYWDIGDFKKEIVNET